MENLTLGLFVYNQVNSAPGSPILLHAQPLLTGKLDVSSVILSGTFFLIAVINQVFHLDTKAITAVPEDSRVVRLSLADLQAMLSAFKTGMENKDKEDKDNIPADAFTIAVGAWSSYGPRARAPLLIVAVPLLTFPLVRGSIPFLILETLVTILVRAVVPPD